MKTKGVALSVCLALGAACGGGGGSPGATGGTSGSPGGGGSTSTGGAIGTGGVTSTGGTGGVTSTGGAGGVTGTGGATDTGGVTGTGGATSTGGAAGGSAGTGGSGGAASVACPAGALLCDDFESYGSATDLAAAWKVTATAATLTVDGSKPFGGSAKSVHVSAPGGTPVGTLVKENAPLFPIAGNVYYGRMMMWLTKAPTGAVHWNNVQSAGYLPNSTQWSKYGWGGMYGTILAGYTIRTMPTDMQAVVDCSKPSKMALPEKKWTCLEWEFDGVGNALHLWLDGKLLDDADVIKTGTQCVTPKPPNDTWQAPTFANLTLGWAQYQSSNVAIDFWMDDVALATTRVGCPSP